MGAILLNGCTIGDGCVIGAGALVPEGKNIPSNSLVVGVPGRIVRSVTSEELQLIRQGADEYIGFSRQQISR
jgi:carbonic anhydrase/acetyltransferase-like protein (isoleucine patch superfamily)